MRIEEARLSNPVASQVLVAGASGTIGQMVVLEALCRGHAVIALVRSVAAQQALEALCAKLARQLKVLVLPALDQAALEPALADCAFDAVVSCLASRSGTRADAWAVDYQANADLLSIARRRPNGHFVLLSAICVQKPALAFQRAKLEFERQLAESKQRYTIVRPTAFFKSLSGQIDRVRRGRPFLLFGDGQQTACCPIDARELAEYLLDCLSDDTRWNQRLMVGGPGPALTARQQGELLFRLLDREPRFRSVSPRLLQFAARCFDGLALIFPRWAERAELARIGYYYATESMLCWDEGRQRYDRDQTPAYGSITLNDFYEQALTRTESNELQPSQRIF